MFTLLISLSPAVLWLLASLGLLLIELATPGLFFFISFAFGCLFGAFSAWLEYPAALQCSVALLVAIIQFSAMRRHLGKLNNANHLRTNVHALVGQVGVVTAPISPVQHGRVKIGSEVWVASADHTFDVDQTVKVARIHGNKVVVKAVK